MTIMLWEKVLCFLAGIVTYATIKVMDHYCDKDMKEAKEAKAQ